MHIELAVYHQKFIIDLFRGYRLVAEIIKKLSQSSTMHPDNDEYIECEVGRDSLEDLVGELSYEANHNRSKIISEQACEAAESLELYLSYKVG